MNNHFCLSDEQFEIEFKQCTLAPSLFSHEAHIRLTWIYIKKYSLEVAIKNICTQLKQYVIKAGATDKYNITLTVAAIKVVNHFIEKSNSDNFPDFIAEFPQLITKFKALIAFHYNEVDIFNSPTAKKTFLEPDVSF